MGKLLVKHRMTVHEKSNWQDILRPYSGSKQKQPERWYGLSILNKRKNGIRKTATHFLKDTFGYGVKN